MNQRTALKAIAAAILSVGFAHAHAGLIVDITPEPPPPPPVRITLTQVGDMPVDIARITVSMKDQSLAKVLSTLVPKGWKGYAADPRIKTIKTTGFEGDKRPWTVVLEEVLKRNKLTGNVNWDKREITIGVSDDFQAG